MCDTQEDGERDCNIKRGGGGGFPIQKEIWNRRRTKTSRKTRGKAANSNKRFRRVSGEREKMTGKRETEKETGGIVGM